MKWLIAVSFGIFIVGGCALIPPSATQFGNLEITESPDGGNITWDKSFSSPYVYAGGWSIQRRYQLRGARDKITKAISHELHVYVSYSEGGPRNFITTATFADGRQQTVTRNNARASYIGYRFGAYEAWFSIPLESTWLSASRISDAKVILHTQLGDVFSIDIPKEYISAYLDAVSTLK